jgi:hypothetical protein
MMVFQWQPLVSHYIAQHNYLPPKDFVEFIVENDTSDSSDDMIYETMLRSRLTQKSPNDWIFYPVEMVFACNSKPTAPVGDVDVD